MFTEPEARASAFETILVAEDDPIFRRLLQASLEDWGYRVSVVEDGATAWEILQRPNTHDLLILDCMMPGINGLDLCGRIRGRNPERYQYILLLSGKDEKEDIVKGLDAGADDYLTKPFDVGELRARLRAGERILSLQHELIKARDALRFQATHDELTGVWSRRAALQLLRTELQRGIRASTATGVLMIDVDHFKRVNDTYGHLVGDAVLTEIAHRISRAVRSYDFVGRYGGEEFLVILSKCTLDDLHAIAERTRRAISGMSISTNAGELDLTASIGGAMTQEQTLDIELLSVADSALYEAKRSGRNRVTIGSSESIPIHKPALGSSEPSDLRGSLGPTPRCPAVNANLKTRGA